MVAYFKENLLNLLDLWRKASCHVYLFTLASDDVSLDVSVEVA